MPSPGLGRIRVGGLASQDHKANWPQEINITQMAEQYPPLHLPQVEYHMAQNQGIERGGIPLVGYP